MHISSFKTTMTIAMVIGMTFAAPQTPDNAELSNEIAGGFIKKNGDSVSASFGGFHASASLADDGSAVASAGGNGLGSGAGYGIGGAGAGAGAGAGLVGAGASSEVKPAAGGYGNGGKPGSAGGSPLYHQGVGNGSGFFDKIFAIPINVLQSVNTYLNQKQRLQGHQGSAHGHVSNHNNNGGAFAAASATAGSGTTYAEADKVPEATAGADYGHQSAGASVNGKPGSPMMIPITALRSVQNLLNG